MQLYMIIEGMLQICIIFRNFVQDNPWNCALNMWWLLNSTMNQHIFDRDKLMCNETSAFKNRPVMVVMEYKQVSYKARM